MIEASKKEFSISKEEELKLLEASPNDYNPLHPNSFDQLYHDLKDKHQIRILKKRHAKIQEAQKKEIEEAKRLQNLTPTKDGVAMKIMNKYGFKEGQGLGRQEQGITQPLYVEKTSRKTGKIVNKHFDTHQEGQSNIQEEYSNANLLKNPTNIILLRNMADIEEIEKEFESEIRTECEKYGNVKNKSKESIDSVRIFVHYEKVSSAVKALIALNRRYFDGKVIHCNFYNLPAFQKELYDETPNGD
ncbi:MAG: Splicing factor 45 [Paramarteilia canceri]